jgi:hypothetical protein
MDKRITLRELIKKLEEVSENGSKDNLPVVINSEFDDYLYDIDSIRIDSYWNKAREEKQYVSINLFDNPIPISLEE